jgi:hypothetical protein
VAEVFSLTLLGPLMDMPVKLAASAAVAAAIPQANAKLTMVIHSSTL